MSRDQRFLILADGLFGPDSSKTANACIRYTPERVVGVIDATRAGSTASDVVGFGGDIPVVATLDEGLALKPNALLIGIAPAGGKLPAEWIRLVARAIEHGLEIWSGRRSRRRAASPSATFAVHPRASTSHEAACAPSTRRSCSPSAPTAISAR